MPLEPIFEQRLAEAEEALAKLLPSRRSEPNDNKHHYSELSRVVALRREELALLRKLYPNSR